MLLKHPKTLITGTPGVGKTTLIKNILAKLPPQSSTGFYTSEIRLGGVRQGFELQALGGDRQILAHVKLSSPWRVGKYRVDVPGLDRFLDHRDLLKHNADVIVIDEIGKMELFSTKFQDLVHQLLTSKRQVLATIAMQGSGFINRVKQMPQVKIFQLTLANRDHLIDQILR